MLSSCELLFQKWFSFPFWWSKGPMKAYWWSITYFTRRTSYDWIMIQLIQDTWLWIYNWESWMTAYVSSYCMLRYSAWGGISMFWTGKRKRHRFQAIPKCTVRGQCMATLEVLWFLFTHTLPFTTILPFSALKFGKAGLTEYSRVCWTPQFQLSR